MRQGALMLAADPMLPAAAIGKFTLGYLAVLATPGPNMLAIGALAALRGFWGALPFCLGIAVGAGTLALLLHLAFGILLDAQGLEVAARAVGGAMLLVVALHVVRTPYPCLPENAPRRHAPQADLLAVVGGGFMTALTNPVTAAYLITQFLGPLGDSKATWLAAPVVALLALLCGLGVARIFGSAMLRRFALEHHRAVCLVSGMALAVLAALLLLPLVRP